MQTANPSSPISIEAASDPATPTTTIPPAGTPSPSAALVDRQSKLAAVHAEGDQALANLRADKSRPLYRRVLDAAGDLGREVERAMHTIRYASGMHTAEEIERARRSDERQAEYRRQELVERCRKACGVRKRYAAANLYDVSFVARECPEVLADYQAARDRLAKLAVEPGIIICHGKNGPGKTHLTSALVNHYVSLGRSAVYTRAWDFFQALTSAFGARGTGDLRRYERCELLVIDEYEVRGKSEWHEQVLRMLVDGRYADDFSTVIVTNLEIEDIAERLPKAARDRMRDCGGDTIHFSWRSLRPFKSREERS